MSHIKTSAFATHNDDDDDNDDGDEIFETNEHQQILFNDDDEEFHKVQRTFSNMIDQTCSNDTNTEGNIFEHTFIPQDWYEFLFRSIVPSHESIKQHLEHVPSQQFFNYEEHEDVKYAFKVLDRCTNQLTYEQMPSYHKYGMRLLFRGCVQRSIMHRNAIKKFFTHETIRLGKAFNDPKSCKHISAFVKMYQINLNELLKPNIADYETFNEFFYRKLKPNARIIADRNNSNVIISAADCRLSVFDNINQATRIWIKGRHFSLRNLFNDEQLAKEFDEGSIAIFRLAPVDYHRYHSPIDGIISAHIKNITGTYYTVNPIAIREKIDVLTKNQRIMITIENDTFDKVAFVAIGALLVGSVNFTVQPCQKINKGDELGNK